MGVKYNNSLDKIIHYLQGVARKPFIYNGKIFKPPKKLYISSKFFRGYLCPENCGGCCKNFSLVYFNYNINKFNSDYPQYKDKIKKVQFKINGFEKEAYELDNSEKQEIDVCSYLGDKKRCLIHKENPLSCRFELKKVSIDEKNNRTIITKKLFGRGWQLNKPIGALCRMTTFSLLEYEQDLRELNELRTIANGFGISHNLDLVLNFLVSIKPKLKEGSLLKDKLFLITINN